MNMRRGGGGGVAVADEVIDSAYHQQMATANFFSCWTDAPIELTRFWWLLSLHLSAIFNSPE